MTHAERLRLGADEEDDAFGFYIEHDCQIAADDCRLYRDALLAGADALEREQWRPIEDAPKDGESFILGLEDVSAGMGSFSNSGRLVIEAGSHELSGATHFRSLPPPPTKE